MRGLNIFMCIMGLVLMFFSGMNADRFYWSRPRNKNTEFIVFAVAYFLVGSIILTTLIFR